MSESPKYSAAVVVAINTPKVLLSQLGPLEGTRALKRCMTRLERVFESHHGKIIDDSGWTMSALFGDTEDAIQAARGMCQRIEQLPPVAGKRITVSVGAARTLDAALALAESASADSVSISNELESSLAGPLSVAPDDDGEDSESEQQYPPSFDRTIVGGTLVLSYHDQRIVVDNQNREITIGRNPQCTLHINTPWASRVHATVVKDGNCFALVDSSTNGTYLSQGKQEIHVHRRVHFLEERGRISVGQSINKGGESILQFEIIH